MADYLSDEEFAALPDSEYLSDEEFAMLPDSNSDYQQRLQEAAQADDPFWLDAYNFAKGVGQTGYGQALVSMGNAKKYAGYDTDLLDKGNEYLQEGRINATRGAGEWAGEYALPVATSLGKNLGLAGAGAMIGGPVGAVGLPGAYYFAETFGNELGQSADAGNTWANSTPMEAAATIGGATLQGGVQAALERLPIKKGIEFIGPIGKRVLGTAGKEAFTEVGQKLADDTMDKMGFAFMGNKEALANTPEMWTGDYMKDLSIVGAQGAAGGGIMGATFHPFVQANQKASLDKINADAAFQNGNIVEDVPQPLLLDAPQSSIPMQGALGIEGPQVFESEAQPEAGRLYAEAMAQQQELNALDGPPLSQVIQMEGPEGFKTIDNRTPLAQQTAQDITNGELLQFNPDRQQSPLESFRGMVNFNEQLPTQEDIDSQSRIEDGRLKLEEIQNKINEQKAELDKVIPTQALAQAVKTMQQLSTLTPEQQKAQVFSTIMKSRKAADNIKLTPEELSAATSTELKQVAIQAQEEVQSEKPGETVLPEPIKVKQKVQIKKEPVLPSESIDTKAEVDQTLTDQALQANQQAFDFDSMNEQNARAEEIITGKKSKKRKPVLNNHGVLRPEVFNDAYSRVASSAKAYSEWVRDSASNLFFDELVANDIPESERWARGYTGIDKTKKIPLGSKVASNTRGGVSFVRTLADKIPAVKEAYRIVSDSQGDRHEYVSKFKEIVRPIYRLNKAEQMGLQKFASEVQRPRYVNGKKIQPDLSDSSLRASGLNERQIIAYRAGRAGFDYSLEHMLKPYLKDVWQKQVKGTLRDTFDGQIPPEVNTAIDKIIGSVKLQNYWPSSRFGSRYVLTTDGNGETATLHFVDSTAQAKAMERDFARQGIKAITGVTKTAALDADNFIPLEFIEKLSNIEADGGNTKNIANLLLDEFIPKGSETLSRIKHKKFIPGYSTDGSTVVSNYILGLSSTVSKSAAKGKIANLLASHPDLKNSSMGGEVNKTRQIIEDYTKSALDEYVPGRSFRTLQSVFFLGGVAKSVFVNATTPFTSMYPKAHALYGNDGKSVLGKLEKEVSNEYIVDKLIAKSVKDEMLWGVNKKKLDPNVRAAIKKAVDRGEINFGVNEEISKRANSLDKEYSLFDTIMLPNNLVEEHNRLLGFITGFNIATKKGMKFEDAYQTAVEFNKDVNHDYTKANQPKLVRDKLGIGANAFLFRQYSGNILRQMRNEMGAKQYGALVRRMGALTMAGGLKAWPFAQMFFLMMTKLGGDPEKKAEKGIMSVLGTDDPLKADAVLYGLPQGLGWFNLSGSLASNELGSISEQSPLGIMGQAVAGPAGGMVGRVERAISVMDSDPEKALTEVMPEFIRSIRVANRAERDKAFTTIDGKTVVENPTPWELWSRRGGFQPPRLAAARQDTQELNALNKNRDGVEASRSGQREAIANEFIWGDIETARAKLKAVLEKDSKITDPNKKFFNDDKDLNNFLTGMIQSAIEKKLGSKFALAQDASKASKPEAIRILQEQNDMNERRNKSPLNLNGLNYRELR